MGSNIRLAIALLIAGLATGQFPFSALMIVLGAAILAIELGYRLIECGSNWILRQLEMRLGNSNHFFQKFHQLFSFRGKR